MVSALLLMLCLSLASVTFGYRQWLLSYPDTQLKSILERDVDTWNEWRAKNRSKAPNFSGLSFANVDLSGANLKNVIFIKSKFQNVNMNKTVLDGAVFVQARFEDTQMRNVRAIGTSFVDTRLENVSFAGAELLLSDFMSAHLISVDFQDARLISSSFMHADLIRVVTKNTICSKIRFSSNRPSNFTCIDDL